MVDFYCIQYVCMVASGSIYSCVFSLWCDITILSFGRRERTEQVVCSSVTSHASDYIPLYTSPLPLPAPHFDKCKFALPVELTLYNVL